MKNTERVQASKKFKVGDWVQPKEDLINSKIIEITQSGYMHDDLGRTFAPNEILKNNPNDLQPKKRL